MHDLTKTQAIDALRRLARTMEASLVCSGMSKPDAAGVADMALRNVVSAVTSAPVARPGLRLVVAN